MEHYAGPINTRDAARRLGLAESTLEKARLTGTGPPFLKLGRTVRYRCEDLDKWLENHLVQSTSQVPGGRS